MSYFYAYNDGDEFRIVELFEEPRCLNTYQNEYGVVTANFVIGTVDGSQELTIEAVEDSRILKIIENSYSDFTELGWCGDAVQAEWKLREINEQRLRNRLEW